ncbi:RHS repeat-associated core domain-containing protein [Kitasatospora indigofera]|uniref:RHS repeat-associated core domain-containing protein n=2 Tax=Kitasatospora indigofera TaxID=67307 RepID=UPI003686DD19
MPQDGQAQVRYGWLGGKQRSAEALDGDILMGARLYSPALGRFLQIDPVPGGNASPYDYCTGDPVNCTDLDGNWGFSFKKILNVVAKVAEVASYIPGPIGSVAAVVSAVSYAATGNWAKAAEMAISVAAAAVGARAAVAAVVAVRTVKASRTVKNAKVQLKLAKIEFKRKHWPEISRQHQDQHINGTKEFNKRISRGDSTSHWRNPKHADFPTRVAWKPGRKTGGDGSERVLRVPFKVGYITNLTTGTVRAQKKIRQPSKRHEG